MINWTEIITIINLIMLIFAAFGGALAYRGAKLRGEQEIAERVQQMFHDENELLQARVKRLEVDNRQLNSKLDAIIKLLKESKNSELTITDTRITLRDGTNTYTTYLRTTGQLPEASKKDKED